MYKKKGDGMTAGALQTLGEAYVMLRDYGKARTYYGKAAKKATGKLKKVCESRLAIISYRMKDYRGALDKIDTFKRKYPTNKRNGPLMLYKMKIIIASKKGNPQKAKELEAIHKELQRRRGELGMKNAVLASYELGMFYKKINQNDRTVEVYTKSIYEMKSIIEGPGVPPKDLLIGFDNMCLILGKYYLDRRNDTKAEQFFDLVNYDQNMKLKAKLLLANLAFNRKAYGKTITSLNEKFLKTVSNGNKIKSNMYLLKGFAYYKKKDYQSAKRCFKEVHPSSISYFQAEKLTGDIYRTKDNDSNAALRSYNNSKKNPKFEAESLYWIGKIHIQYANDLVENKQEKKLKDHRNKAVAALKRLVANYPLSNFAGLAKPLLLTLKGQGHDVGDLSGSKGGSGIGDKSIKQWIKTAKTQAGTNAAAQALLSLIEHYSTTVENTKQKNLRNKRPSIVKAADWVECAAAADKIIKSKKPFKGVSLETWKGFSATAHYKRALCELKSMPPGPRHRKREGKQPNLLMKGGNPAGDPAEALRLLKTAKTLVAKNTEMDKILSYAIIEAMFKSTDYNTQKAAREQYEEMEADNSNDPRYQNLALELADWFIEMEKYELAAQSYRSISKRTNIEKDQAMNLLYLAGVYYSRAGKKKRGASGQKLMGIYIYPLDVIRMATFLETHKPFQDTKTIYWDRRKGDLTAGVILERVSIKFGVPFVWSNQMVNGTIGSHLANTRIASDKLAEFNMKRSLKDYLKLLIPKKFAVDFDLGVSGGKPTFYPEIPDDMDIDALERIKMIEIFDPKVERFKKMSKPYGNVAALHKNNFMMFHILGHIEEKTKAQVVWADGVSKEDVLATEYPPAKLAGARTFADVLRKTLEPLNMDYRITVRDQSGELFNQAKDCFNDLRKYGADSVYSERAMFLLAINYYEQKEYDKMRIVLREYLKIFDSPTYPHYYDASFWLGWLYENERIYREAVKYYALASEESVVLYKREPEEKMPTLDELKEIFSADTLYNISITSSMPAGFKDASLDKISNFIRFNSNVELKFDQSVDTSVKINRPPC